MDNKVNEVGFTRLKKVSLSDQIADQIIAMISNGVLKSGEQLPSERELAKILSVSRLPLREALKSLQSLNVIEVQQGEGYFVKNLTYSRLLESFNLENAVNSDHFLEDLYAARITIETGAVEQACFRHTEEDIHILKSCLEDMRRDALADDCDERANDSLRFHDALINASKNQIYISMMGCLRDTLYQARKRLVHRTVGYNASISEHEAIIQAIIDRNVVAAKEGIFNHLSRVYKSE